MPFHACCDTDGHQAYGGAYNIIECSLSCVHVFSGAVSIATGRQEWVSSFTTELELLASSAFCRF